MEPKFIKTTGEVIRDTGISRGTVHKYIQLGLLPYITLGNGQFLLPEDASARVLAVFEERRAQWGRRPSLQPRKHFPLDAATQRLPKRLRRK